jgi:hypothetical protein
MLGYCRYMMGRRSCSRLLALVALLCSLAILPCTALGSLVPWKDYRSISQLQKKLELPYHYRSLQPLIRRRDASRLSGQLQAHEHCTSLIKYSISSSNSLWKWVAKNFIYATTSIPLPQNHYTPYYV